MIAEDHVFGGAVFQNQPAFVAVLGDVAHTRLTHAAGVVVLEFVAQILDRAGVMLQPCHGLDQFGLTVALHASDAEDLTGPHGETDVVDLWAFTGLLAHGQVFDFEGRARRMRLSLLDREDHLAPNHHPGDLWRGDAGCWNRADHASAPHHRDSIGHLNHLAQFVRNKNYSVASFGVGAQELE